ncbi:hypothetical protein HPB52_005490 [Rhipicephalus sanguineus]|uniref:Uncharacterized protein n=1 Tax=Rhipicephalus sanguineus TaxID=34632 RepID=A0A9D4SXT9_RHISA|nr:hypothetical protein HPB52_005490 [Rhipicephalus sanguineus]
MRAHSGRLHNHLENHERRQAQPPVARWREFREGDRVWVKGTRPCDPAWMVGVLISRSSAVTYVVSVENHERFVHADHIAEATFPVVEKPEIRHAVLLPKTRRPLSSENARPIDSTPTGPPSVEDRTPEPATPRATSPACDVAKTTPSQRPDHGEPGIADAEPPRPVTFRRNTRERWQPDQRRNSPDFLFSRLTPRECH